MSVEICGAVLASLFYENSNESCDQEGLLLGKLNSHVTDTISDSQISNVKKETFINVYAYLRCGAALSWYDSCGRVDKSKLKAWLPPESHKDVIGWYKFRRNSSMAVSMRESAVHKGLRREFLNRHDDHFVFLLCTSEENSVTPTLSYNHVFHTFGPTGIKCLPSEIVNLGDTSHNEYKRVNAPGPDSDMDLFTQTLSSLRDEFHTRQGEMHSVISTRALASAVQRQLQELCSSVSRSEDELGKLRSQVKDMKQALALKRKPPADEMEHADITTTSTKPRVKRQDHHHGDVAMDMYSPMQRLSGRGSSPKPRRMSSLSEQESIPREFDLQRDTSLEPVALFAEADDSLSNEAVPSNEQETQDLISFADEEIDNAKNQAMDTAQGFEDSFVNMTMEPQTPVLKPNPTPVAYATPTLPPVLTPQPANKKKTLKEVANERHVQKSSKNVEKTQSSDDPFSNLANIQRKQLLNHAKKQHIKDSQSRSSSNSPIEPIQSQKLPQKSTARSARGQTRSAQGQTKVNLPPTSPEKPIVVDEDANDTMESDSPSF